MINKISKITIYVDDQEAAKSFWCEKLDFVVTFEQQMGPMMKWIEVAPREATETTFVLYSKAAMLMQKENANVSHPNIILSTQNINEAYEAMQAKGVEVGEMMHMPYGSMFSFNDHEGNAYLLREN